MPKKINGAENRFLNSQVRETHLRPKEDTVARQKGQDFIYIYIFFLDPATSFLLQHLETVPSAFNIFIPWRLTLDIPLLPPPHTRGIKPLL